MQVIAQSRAFKLFEYRTHIEGYKLVAQRRYNDVKIEVYDK